MYQPNQDAELLRSLRREIGAPSRPASSRAGADGNGGGGSRGDGRGGPGPSRRMVPGSSGGVNDLSSMGLLRGMLLYVSATAEEDLALIRRDFGIVVQFRCCKFSFGVCPTAGCCFRFGRYVCFVRRRVMYV